MKLSPAWLAWPETETLIKAYGKDADKLRFVGGAVRDAVLKKETSDVDAATIFTPEQTTELLTKAGIRAIPTGIKHGTITALIDKKNFEITTLRRDTSCDGRHAEVEFTDNWQEDAARRDFTMNAMYLNTDGELFDFFDGVKDAKAGKIRFIGDARQRIQEDYLRILRFFRFYAYYGKASLDAKSLDACYEFALKIESLSGERIQHEMLKLLASPVPFPALEAMQKTGVLAQVCGYDIHLKNAIKRVSFNGELCLALLILSADKEPLSALEILSSRWRLSADYKKQLHHFVTYVDYVTPNTTLATQKQLIRKLGMDVYSSVVELRQALEPEVNYSEFLEFAKNWQIPLLPVSGKDLIEQGFTQGKELGAKLHELEILWEKSDYTLTKEELLKR